MSPRVALAVFITWTLFCLVLGAAIHERLTRKEPPVAETVAGEIRQDDGSLVVTRIPVPAENLPAPPHAVPKGAVEERRISITVRPHPGSGGLKPASEVSGASTGGLASGETGSTNSEASNQRPHCPATMSAMVCPDVTVDLSLIRDKSGRRVVASSPDGEVLGGLDVPLFSEEGRPVARTSLSAAYAGRDRYSATLMREFRPLGVPIHAGAGVIAFDGQTVPALAASIPLPW